MNLYSYDNNGIYMGVFQAQRNPMFGKEGEPEFLKAAKSTFTAPPEVGPNQVAKFQNGAWTMITDPAYTFSRAREKSLKLLEVNEFGVKKYVEDGDAYVENPDEQSATEAAAWQVLRQKRNALLAATDFVMLSDVPQWIVDLRSAVTTYRQELRDFPETVEDPTETLTWPENPLES